MKRIFVLLFLFIFMFFGDSYASKFGQVIIRDEAGATVDVDSSSNLSVVSKGIIDSNNSSVSLLGIGGVFPGVATEVLDYSHIYVSVYSNVASATDGLSFQQSSDGSNWDITSGYTVEAGVGKVLSFNPGARYYRIVYTNGGVGQSSFRLQSVLKKNAALPTIYKVSDSISQDLESFIVKSVLSIYDIDTGYLTPVRGYNGAINTHISDTHEDIINKYLAYFTGTTTNLAANALAGATSITVVSDAAFSVGDYICICEGVTEEINFLKITAKPGGNVITLDRPLDNPYTTATPAYIEKVVIDLSTANGTLTSPVIFKASPRADEIWHVTMFLASIQDNLAMSTGTFGGIPSLTNGVLFRKVLGSGATKTVTNWKNNADIMEDSYKVNFHDRGVGGDYGLATEHNLLDFGAYIRLNGADGDYFEVRVQDDLTALVDLQIKVKGHFGE